MGANFQWGREGATLGGGVTVIQCNGDHGGFAHGANPQAQLFSKGGGRVKIEFWWTGCGGGKSMAIKAMMIKPSTPSFNGKRIKGQAENGGAIFAQSTYTTLREKSTNSVTFELDDRMSFGGDSPPIAVRMLFSLYAPTFDGRLYIRATPLTSGTELMVCPLGFEERGPPKVLECRDILDAALPRQAMAFGKVDLTKAPLLLDHDPVYDIIEECRANGARFSDPDFRACDDSLRLSGERKPRHADNNPNPKDRGSPWGRVAELYDTPEVFVDSVSADDMSQGALGNCWFIGQLSCLGMHEEILEALMYVQNER